MPEKTGSQSAPITHNLYLNMILLQKTSASRHIGTDSRCLNGVLQTRRRSCVRVIEIAVAFYVRVNVTFNNSSVISR